MAGAACKIIINNGVRSVSESLEKVLTNPLVRGVMISEEESDRLLQRLVDIDLDAYAGLKQILAELTDMEVFTDEVAEMYNLSMSVSTSDTSDNKKHRKEKEKE